MDIENILNEFTKYQKQVVFSFVVLFPLCFTVLYLYIPELRYVEFHLQLIFGLAFSVSTSFLSLFTLIKVPKWFNRPFSNLGLLVFPNAVYLILLIVFFDFLSIIKYWAITIFAVSFNIIFAHAVYDVLNKRFHSRKEKPKDYNANNDSSDKL